jgi:general secretion pathway protein B
MSFILDALKKSESDRQRQTGPALFEVKVAPPKARFPVWAVAIAGLLVINMMIVGWLLLRRSPRGDETAAAAQNTPPAASAPTPAPPNGPSTNGNTWSPSVATLPPPPTNATPSANGQSNNVASATSPSPSTQFGNAQQSSAMSGPPTQQSSPPAPQSMPPAAPQPGQPPARLSDRDQNEPTLAGTPRDSGADTGASPDDYAPATDPGSSPFKGHVRRGTESGFMLYQDLAVAAGSDLPQLRLDLHVYAAKPQDRFALINMRKLHEGDSLQGGVRVEAITPDGVVMSHNGTKFLLPRE